MIYLIIQVILSAIAVAFGLLCIWSVSKLLDLILTRLDKIEAKLDALATAKTQEEEKKTATAETPPSSP